MSVKQGLRQSKPPGTNDLTPGMEEWVTKHFRGKQERMMRNSLWRLRNNKPLQDQVFEHLDYLRSKGFGIGTLQEFVVGAGQMATIIGNRDLTTATPQDWLTWNNTDRHVAEVLRPIAGGTIVQATTWTATHKSRQKKQRAFIKFLARRLRAARVPPELAEAQAKAIVIPTKLQAMPPPKRQRWRSITESQFADILRTVPRLRLSEVERAMTPCILHILHENGSRSTSFLPCRIASVDRNAAGEPTGITAPTGRGNKQNSPLSLGNHLAALANWLTWHPEKENPDAPLFISPLAWESGEVLPLLDEELKLLLKRLGKAAGIEGYLGVRSFRRLHHAEAAANGASDHDMRLMHGHSETSPMPGVYTRFDHDQAMRVMARIRGIPPTKKQTCARCRHFLRVGDLACTWCGHPVFAGEDAKLLQDPAAQNLEAAGRLALECLQGEAEEVA